MAAGGAVAPAPAGPQVELLTVVPAGPGRDDPLFAALGAGAPAAHWNNDVVTVAPPGSVPLASTPAGLEAFRLGGAAWGVQFHPEVTPAILRSWGAADVLAGLLTAEQVKNRLAEVQSADARRPGPAGRSWAALQPSGDLPAGHPPGRTGCRR